jgi:hypothetical protein
MIITTFKTTLAPKLKYPWKTISVLLGRGEYTPYNRLPDLMKSQWDAFEDFLISISHDRHLYVAGRFTSSPNSVKTYCYEIEKRAWLGTCKAVERNELHTLLTDNPAEWFEFIITDESVSDETAKIFINVPRKKHFFEYIIDLEIKPYLIIEENNDLDNFDIAYKEENQLEIFSSFSSSLSNHGLEFSPTENE